MPLNQQNTSTEYALRGYVDDFYRAGHTTINKRNLKRLSGKKNWFKKKETCEEEQIEKRKENRERTRDKDDLADKYHQEELKEETNKTNKKTQPLQEPKSVIFVPYTPNSKLAKEMREVEEMMLGLTGTKFKIVEKIGKQLTRAIVEKNPWKGGTAIAKTAYSVKRGKRWG